MKKSFAGLVLSLTLVLVTVVGTGQVFAVPPPPCDFWGQSSTFDGAAIATADTIMVKDPDGVWCGVQYWWGTGEYAIHVYGDDPDTPEDEGAAAGDTITFYMNNENWFCDVISGSRVWSPSGSVQLELAGFSNRPPEVGDIPNVTFPEDSLDSSIDLDDYVTDAYGDTVSWTYSGNVNVNVAIGADNVVTFTAFLNWNGQETITFTAIDPGGLSDSDSTVVTVTPVNDAPVLDPVADITVAEDDTVCFSPTATDVDGDTLTFSYSGWMADSCYVTNYYDAGVHTVTVTVSDGELTDFQDVTVAVLNTVIIGTVTDAPIAGAIVQVWDSYPTGSVVGADTTAEDGFYRITGLSTGTYDVRAYAAGYFPGLEEDISVNAAAEPVTVNFILQPVPAVSTTPYNCDFWGGNATLDGYPLQVGDVISAVDPNGVICGAAMITTGPGQYLVHITGDDPETTEDEGAEEGDPIVFWLNNTYSADSGPHVWTNLGSSEYDVPFLSLQVEVPLDAGWNLFSFPVTPANDSISGVLESLPEGSYTYLAGYVNGQWDTWALGRPPFANDLQTLNPYQGYWIKMVNADTLVVSGPRLPANTPIPLDAAWNLISYLPAGPDSLGHALASLSEGSYTYLAGYVNGQWDTWALGRPPFANDLQGLNPGQGYWVKMASADTLRYPTSGYTWAGGVAKPIAVLDKSSFGILSTPWVCDFWSEATPLDGVPLKVGDVITAKDPDGVVCGAAVVEDTRGYLLHVYGDDLLTTPGVDEGATEGDRVTFYINGQKAAVASGSPVWTQFGSERLTLSASSRVVSTLPKECALWQNQPNPFNPQTTLRFDLPVKGMVSLTVYNIKGQLVRTLVGGEKEAGRHSVVWDGRDHSGRRVASGVYLYRLETEGFLSTKRMVLIK